ncbi:MAG: hypothetical protein KGJ62_10875 [Armatimonadetes bacterium]|nr:hypothetical protein [Armatimonadota bacterium]MDE2207680.1 hypothetical protein [Armatimonadota bacterium]
MINTRIVFAFSLLMFGSVAPLRAQAPISISGLAALPLAPQNLFSWQATFINNTPRALRLRVTASVSAAAAGSRFRYPILPSASINVPASSRVTRRFGPIRWTPGRASWWWPKLRGMPPPVLHRLVVRAAAAGPSASAGLVFGFCTPRTASSGLSLNGVPVRLRGVSLRAGPTTTPAAFRRAIVWLQGLCGNAVLVTGPLPHYVLRICDSLGIMVVATLPEGSAAGALTADACLHPSLFAWRLPGRAALAPPGMDLRRPLLSAELGRQVSRNGYTRPPDGFTLSGNSVRLALDARRDRYRSPTVWLPAAVAAYPLEVPPAPVPGQLDTQRSGMLASLALLTSTWAPSAVYDSAYDAANERSNGVGRFPASPLQIPAGHPLLRTLTVFNDTFAPQTYRLVLRPELMHSPGLASVLPLQRGTGQVAIGGNGAQIGVTRKPRARAGGIMLPAVVQTVSVPAGAQVSVPVAVPVPQVAQNTRLNLWMSLEQGSKLRYRAGEQFVLVPPGSTGATVQFMALDSKTQGAWSGVYGSEGFLIPLFDGLSEMQKPELILYRGLGIILPVRPEITTGSNEIMEGSIFAFLHQRNSTDTRLPNSGPGLPARAPAAFSGGPIPMAVRMDTSDGKAHRAAIYLLDFNRAGYESDVSVFDTQGDLLDSRLVANYGDGVWLTWRFTGKIVIRVSSLTMAPSLIQGVCVDPLP